METKVSIIIPVYNAESYLRECLSSVKSQTFTDFECFCIDNKSTDKSEEIIREFANQDHRFQYLFEQTPGPSPARNCGLDHALGGGGDYICFIDADDTVEPDYLETYLNAARRSNADLVFGTITQRRQTGSLYDYVADTSGDMLVNNIARGLGGTVWGKLYRSALLRDVRFDPNFTMREDMEFNLRTAEKIKTVCYIKDCGYHYRIVESSLSHKARQKVCIASPGTFEIAKLYEKLQPEGYALGSFLKSMLFWDLLHLTESKQSLRLVTTAPCFVRYKRFIKPETPRERLFLEPVIKNHIGIARMVYRLYVKAKQLPADRKREA